jgi:polysaccharide biosynthesis transport protein
MSQQETTPVEPERTPPREVALVETARSELRPEQQPRLPANAEGFEAEGSFEEPQGLASYAHAFRRRWLISAVAALPLAAVVAAAVWCLQPRTYTATAILRLASVETPLVFETADATTPNSFDVFKRTQRQLLRSRFVMLRALRDEKISRIPVIKNQPDPIAWLEANLLVTFPDESEIMHVALATDEPGGLHEIVNSLVEAYFAEVVFSERDRKLGRLSSLEVAYKNAETELRKKRTELRQLVERIGVADTSSMTLVQQNTLQQFAAFQQRLAQVHFDLMQIQGELDLREESIRANDEDIQILDVELSAGLRSDRVAEKLLEERRQLTEYIEATSGRVRTGVVQPKVDSQLNRIKTIDRKLEQRRTALRTELIENKRLAAADGADELKRKAAVLASQEKQIQIKVQELENEVRQAGRSSIDVEMMRSEIAALQDVLGGLSKELERTRVELQSDSKNAWNRVVLLSEAQPARSDETKTRIRAARTAGAGAMGLLLPFVAFVWLDARKNRINTDAEVTRGLRLPVIGTIPMIPRRIMQRLHEGSSAALHWRSLLTESIDSIAAVLLHEAEANRVVLVSSATTGEGKSTLAAHLAASLAGAGRSTLVVDFDLRRPSLHRVFGTSLAPGVSEVLCQGQELDTVIVATGIANLMALPAGNWNRAGLGGLTSESLGSVFRMLRDRFDMIVVDGSPILPVVDARIIAQHVDGVLLSVMRDVSCVPQVRAACDLLDQFGVPILGAVVAGRAEEHYHSYGAITESPSPGGLGTT